MNNFETFFFLCRCLSFSEQKTCRLRREIIKDHIDWQDVIGIADRHFVLPLLFKRLQKKGLLAILPQDIKIFLDAVYNLNSDRSQSLIRQVYEIGSLFNSIKKEPILLKGAGMIFSKIYEDPALRMMTDIDLLVPSDRMKDCVQIMIKAGYDLMKGTLLPENYHHYMPLVHKKYTARVELHQTPVETLYASLLNAYEMWSQSYRFRSRGVQMRIPSIQHFILHNIIHHQLSRDEHQKRKVLLYQMYDMVMLRNKFGSSINWKEIDDRFAKMGYRNSLLSYLVTSGRLFQLPIPRGIHLTGPHILSWHLFYQCGRYPWLGSIERFASRMCDRLPIIIRDPKERKYFAKKLLKRRTYFDKWKSFFNQVKSSKTIEDQQMF